MKWDRQEFELTLVFLFSFGAFCQQGIRSRMTMPSTHLLIFFIFLSSALLHKFYTSVLVSIIVGPRYISDIKTKEDLADSDMPIGFFNSVYGKDFILVSCVNYYLIFGNGI